MFVDKHRKSPRFDVRFRRLRFICAKAVIKEWEITPYSHFFLLTATDTRSPLYCFLLLSLPPFSFVAFVSASTSITSRMPKNVGKITEENYSNSNIHNTDCPLHLHTLSDCRRVASLNFLTIGFFPMI